MDDEEIKCIDEEIEEYINKAYTTDDFQYLLSAVRLIYEQVKGLESERNS